MRQALSILPWLISLLIASPGCFKMTPPVTSLTAAEEKFHALCRDEYGFSPVTRLAGNTYWVYLPFEEPFLEYKASAGGPSSSPQKSTRWAVNYLKAAFEKGTFRVQYDIALTRTYPQDPGYANAYSQEFQDRNRQITTAITRAFFEVGEVPGDITFADAEQNATHRALVDAHLPRDTPPEFFVVVLADIKSGLVVKTVMYLEDLKRAMSSAPSLPQEEFALRYLSEIYGQASIVGDKEGKSLDHREVRMGDFLAQQIEKRVRARFATPEASPEAGPETDVAAEILAIVRRTLGYYDFTGFDSIALHDLADDAKSLFPR